jgi:hypothetical protein
VPCAETTEAIPLNSIAPTLKPRATFFTDQPPQPSIAVPNFN